MFWMSLRLQILTSTGTANTNSCLQDWDKPETIPDPDAKKPEDWDDDMDGEWEPPMITNPDYKVDYKL